jgi:hypothetical protein
VSVIANSKYILSPVLTLLKCSIVALQSTGAPYFFTTSKNPREACLLKHTFKHMSMCVDDDEDDNLKLLLLFGLWDVV